MESTGLQSVYQRIAEGRLFEQYRDAFLAATGLPLMLVHADEETWIPCTGGDNESPFCQELNTKNHVCEACIAASRELRDQFPCAAPSHSVTCFAGLKETAVPIRLGSDNFAFLKTGEVFDKEPTRAGFERVKEILGPLGYTDYQLGKLEKAYFATPVVEGPRYEGVVALLATFAEHLQRQVEELLLQTVQSNAMVSPLPRAIPPWVPMDMLV